MKFILIIVIVFFSGVSMAQNNYQIKFCPVNVDNPGSSIRIDLRKSRPKSVFYAGINYLINPPRKARYYNATYANKAWANNTLQRFMYNIGYERSILFKKGTVRVYPFLEFTIAYTGLKTESYLVSNNSSQVRNYNFVYSDVKLWWLINHTGVGAEIFLTEKISLAQQIGFCPALITETTNNRTNQFFEAGIENPFYSVGIIYNFRYHK